MVCDFDSYSLIQFNLLLIDVCLNYLSILLSLSQAAALLFISVF